MRKVSIDGEKFFKRIAFLNVFLNIFLRETERKEIMFITINRYLKHITRIQKIEEKKYCIKIQLIILHTNKN